MLINPIWFYLLGMLDSIKLIVLLSNVVVIMLVIVHGVVVTVNAMDYGWEDEDVIKHKKPLFMLLKILALLLVLTTIIPTKETATKMLIATQVTHENIDSGTEAVKEAVDYIFEKIDSLD